MIDRRAIRPLFAAILLGALSSGLAAQSATARVVALEIERRQPLLDGRPFVRVQSPLATSLATPPSLDHDGRGGGGIAYELIEGRVRFAFDPSAAANARVNDLDHAPRNAAGQVEAWGDFAVLQPIDPARRRGTAIVDVPNRGRRLVLAGMNRARLDFFAPPTIDASDAASFGDGFLMSQGLTVLWAGWQADAPEVPGSMRLHVPRAVGPDGEPIRGQARSDWVVDTPSERLALATRGHVAHPAARKGDAGDVLTRRRGRNAQPQPVPRASWRFDETREAIVPSDPSQPFEAGFIYELAYEAESPPVVGLGFAAYRDFAAYALYDPECPFAIQRAVAHGLSQSGRFLRHFLYEGFNRDEAGRRVFDGAMILIGGAGRGGFNHRFSHPGRVGNPYQNFFYPGDDFPFTSRPTRDGERREGLLDRVQADGSMPRVFQINTGYEYWGRGASLIHTTPDGDQDVAPLEAERLYHVASAPHGSLPFPPAPRSEVSPGLFVGSSVDTSGIQRALLVHLLRWVEEDAAPPPSTIPHLADGTLVRPGSLRYPIADLARPRAPHLPARLDFGPRFDQGIIDRQPAIRGADYGVRVPVIDALGNEATGIRPLELRVPIGTYTPWALRHGAPGGSDEMTGYLGSFLPLAPKESERRPGDARPALATLHPDRDAYEQQLSQEIDGLVEEGFLLPLDRRHAYQAGLERWHWAHRSAGRDEPETPPAP